MAQMTDATSRPSTGPARTGWETVRPVLPWLVFGLAFSARLAPVLRGGGLRGLLAYDDGVYFGAADALLFGRLPYRDFLLLHPPGVLLVLAPFAELGRLTSDPVGLAAARLAFMALGGLNAVLVYLVAGRVGRGAGVVAGLLYAFWGPAVYAERTVLLEPLVNLGLLGSAALLGDVRVVTRRRLLAAGAVLGAAVAVKLWAGLALVMLALWVWRGRGRSAAASFAVAAAVAAGAVCLPFLVPAPVAMLRMVVLDQLGRPGNGVPIWQRLSGVTGPGTAAGDALGPGSLAALAPTVALVAAAAVVVARHAPGLRVWVALLVGQLALLLAGPVYYGHYATFAAPALAVVLGAAAGVLGQRARARAPRLVPVVAAACVLGLALVAVSGAVHRDGRRVPAGRVQAAVAGAWCVRADSVAALVATNLLTRDLRRGCPLTIDVTGVTYDLDPSQLADGRPGAARRADPAWQRFLLDYIAGADAFIVVQERFDGLGPGARDLLDPDRVLLRTQHLTVYAPSSPQ